MPQEHNPKNKITELKVTLVKPNKGFIGFAGFVFDGYFRMDSIAIYFNYQKGYYLLYPREKKREKYHYFFPINKEIGEEIKRQVVAEIENEMEVQACKGGYK